MLSDFDGSNLYVSGGGSLALPALTTFTNLANYNDQYRTWQASGPGSVLDVRNVASVINSSVRDSNFTIETLAGATVDLAGLAQINDPPLGDQSYRAVNVTADGLGSTLNLSSLASFVDSYGSSTGGPDRFSTLTAQNSGTLTLSATQTTLTGVLATVQTGGTLTGNLQLAQSTLQGNGTIVGNIQNGGTVQPGTSTGAGTLTVTGNYGQFAAGALNLNIGGLTAGSQFDQLAVGGSAMLAGTVNVSLASGYTPNIADSFKVLTFAARTGDFQTYNGLSAGNGHVFAAGVRPHRSLARRRGRRHPGVAHDRPRDKQTRRSSEFYHRARHSARRQCYRQRYVKQSRRGNRHVQAP